MKSSKWQFGLLAMVIFPALLAATNCLALSWMHTEDWTYLVEKSPGVVEVVTSKVRLIGWPIAYNVAYPSESFGIRNMHWIPLVIDCLTATLVALAVFWLFRYALRRRYAV